MPSIVSLIGSGIGFGCIHVLTGPDHLSALATLSANVGSCNAFFLGVQWGMGHSTGLIVVGVILISITSGDYVQVPKSITVALESLVGVFMLLLGSFGMVRACRKRPSQQQQHVDELPLTSTPTEVDGGNDLEKGEASISMADVGQTASLPTSRPSELSTIEVEQQSQETRSTTRRGAVLQTGCSRCLSNISTKMLACVIGIVHGVAGPGGVLGVIPAVELKNWKYSTIYLGSFCIASTLCMGCFAALYGTCSRKLGKERGKRGEFVMECFSASLSIIVGVLWLVLLACGKLEDVFP